MKRVLIFSLNYYPRFIGGAEVAIKEITDRIDSSDIEFHMVTLRFDSSLPKVEKVGNVLVHRIGFTKKDPDIAELKGFPLHLNKILFQFLSTCKAIHLHKKYHYDGTWAMMAHSAGVPAALFKMWNPQVPYLLTLQEGDPIDYIKHTMRFVYPIFARAFTRADIVQVISTFLGRWARDMDFVGPIEVVPNAVDTKHFSEEYRAEQLSELKQKLGKSSDDIFLITTSRLVAKNAVDDVIRALALLPKEIKFLILGVGPDEATLRALADELKVSDRVKFLRQVDHKEMPKYLAVSDIFIRPSRSEGLGISFLEAMAAGLPVIATPVGGIPDFLFDPEKNPDHEPTGLFCNVDDSASIAEQIKRLIADPALHARLVANGKKLVTEKYDWNLIARYMKEKVFDKLLIPKN